MVKTWAEFKASVDSQLKSRDIPETILISYIDWDTWTNSEPCIKHDEANEIHIV